MKTILFLLTSISMAFSAPALNGEMKFKQENNSTFTGELKGDEFFSWVEDKQGNIIKYNANSKNYEYAEIKINNSVPDLVPSGTKVVDIKESNNSISASSQRQPQKIDRAELSKIWNRKRDEAQPHQLQLKKAK